MHSIPFTSPINGRKMVRKADKYDRFVVYFGQCFLKNCPQQMLKACVYFGSK